jgi:hypothetical protein
MRLKPIGTLAFIALVAWWEQEQFVRSLAIWWQDAALECLRDVFRTAELANSAAGADNEPVWLASHEAMELAIRTLGDWCRHQSQQNSEAA